MLSSTAEEKKARIGGFGKNRGHAVMEGVLLARRMSMGNIQNPLLSSERWSEKQNLLGSFLATQTIFALL